MSRVWLVCRLCPTDNSQMCARIAGQPLTIIGLSYVTTLWPSVVTVHSLDARHDTTAQRKQQYLKRREERCSDLIIMINESNERKIQRRLQRMAVSVITHAMHAFTLRKNFNATYMMHNNDTGRSQRRQRSVWKVDKPDAAHTQH